MPLSLVREITDLKVKPLEQSRGFTARSVFPELENGDDLDFAGKATQHATHEMHPYVAAINPPLAAALIQHYVPQDQLVLDPFCGGGGVLVESILRGRRALGCDINPLAVLISKAKTSHLPSAVTLRTYMTLVERAEKLQKDSFDEDVPDLVRFWYQEDSLAPLAALRTVVNDLTDDAQRGLFQTALSATARDVMLTYRGEVRLRKLQEKDLERFRPNVFSAFKRRALLAIKSVAELPPNRKCNVLNLDCRKLAQEHECHAVITSPPYGDDKNGIGYFQFSRNMLYWLGFTLEELKRQRELFLGCGSDSDVSPPPSETLMRTLDVIKERKTTHHREAINFYSDYFEGLKRITAVTRERVIIVIGDRVLSRTRINNGHITTELMNALGWSLEHYYTRQLKKKRIANLGGDGGGISLEHIMVFRRS